MIFINASPDFFEREHSAIMPPWAPIGVAYLCEVLKRNGIKSYVVDQQVDNHIVRKIKKITKNIVTPPIFGFSVITAAYKNAIKLAAVLKKLYPDSIIIFGGVHPSAIPDETLKFDHIDIVVRGEAENIITELYNCLKSGRDYSHINNLSFKKNGEIIHNEMLIINNLDSLPFFPYSLYRSKKYDLGFIISSRGCPYNCVFCCSRTTNLGIYRSRKVENIISELNELFYNHKIRHVAFLDENFLTNHNWVKSLCCAIKQSSFHNRMFFSFQTRGDNVNNEILKTLFETGFRTTFIAIETASENLMSVINKGESVKQVLSALENAGKQGFVVATNLLFGLPEETQKDRDNAIELLKTLDVDFVKINKAIPFPGTPLNKMAFRQDTLNIKNLYENFYSTSILLENPFKNNPFPFLPHGNSEIEIRRDIYKAFFAFYFNWKKIKKTISNIKVGNSFGYSYAYYLRRLPNILLFGIFMLLNLFKFFFKYIPYKISKIF